MSAPAFLSGRLCALRAGHCLQCSCPCAPGLRAGVVPKCPETSWFALFHVKMVNSLHVSPGISLQNKCQSWSTVLGSRICFVRGSFAFQRLSRLIKLLQRPWNSETFTYKESFFDLLFYSNNIASSISTFKTGHPCIHLRESVAQQTCDKPNHLILWLSSKPRLAMAVLKNNLWSSERSSQQYFWFKSVIRFHTNRQFQISLMTFCFPPCR